MNKSSPSIETILAQAVEMAEPAQRQAFVEQACGGELVRRVSGRPFDVFFREEVAGPLGLDFHIGLSEEHEPRVAPTIRPDPPPPGEPSSRFQTLMATEPDSLQALAVKNSGRRTAAGDYDSREAHRAVLPSQGGITNARGLAGMYAPLAQGGGSLVDADTLNQTSVVSSAIGVDATLLIGLRIALGFWKSSDNRQGPLGARDSILLSEEAFGHPGMGGSLGFADPAAKMSFGYIS
jgi:CubicO group peptidase (beta-lactamase class C family)